jgi:hypothetical protein
MTSAQFASAAGAESKWLLNSSALLRRRLRRDPSEASWWGLIRLLESTFGIPLQPAARIATEALRHGPEVVWIRALSDASGSASVMVNLQRYRSVTLANLSRALVRETPRVRGRRKTARDPIAMAAEYGLDISLMKLALEKTPAERLAALDANRAFVAEMQRNRSAL